MFLCQKKNLLWKNLIVQAELFWFDNMKSHLLSTSDFFLLMILIWALIYVWKPSFRENFYISQSYEHRFTLPLSKNKPHLDTPRPRWKDCSLLRKEAGCFPSSQKKKKNKGVRSICRNVYEFHPEFTSLYQLRWQFNPQIKVC